MLFIEYMNLPMYLANKFVKYFTKILMKVGTYPTYLCTICVIWILVSSFKLKNKYFLKYLSI